VRSAHLKAQREAQESLEASKRGQADLLQDANDQNLINEFNQLGPEGQKRFIHHSGDRVKALNLAFARQRERDKLRY